MWGFELGGKIWCENMLGFFLGEGTIWIEVRGWCAGESHFGPHILGARAALLSGGTGESAGVSHLIGRCVNR